MTIEPERGARDTPDGEFYLPERDVKQDSFYFASLPPWWNSPDEQGNRPGPPYWNKSTGDKSGSMTLPAGPAPVLPPRAASEGATSASPSPNGEIEGRLVDDVTGQPVAGAEVSCMAFINDWLDPGEIKTTVTDDDGRYRLKVSSPGIYDVWLAKYAAEAHMTAVDDDGLVVEPYKRTSSRLRLIRARMLAGTLVDREGNPLAGVTVIGMSSARQAPESVKTASDGSFRLPFPPGRAYVYAYANTEASDAESLTARDYGGIILEVPRTGNLPSPVTLKLVTPEREVASYEWLKHSSPGTQIVGRTDKASISGMVVDGAGTPIAGAKVFPRSGPIVLANEKGKFRVACDEDMPIVLYAFQPGYQVWHGGPRGGDVLKVVLEEKPATAEATVGVRASATEADRGSAVMLPMPATAVDAWPVFRGDLACTGVAHTTLPKKPDLLWKKNFHDGSFVATAAIVDGVVYVGNEVGTLRALDLATGEVRWQYDSKTAFKEPPAVGNGAVYIGDDDGKFHAIHAADGVKKWSVASEAEINAGASFYGDKVLFTSQDGGFYCLDPSDGTIVWKYTIDNAIQCSPTVVGNRGFLAACDGKLHVVDLDRGDRVAMVEIGEPTLCTPAVLGGLVYFGTMGEQFWAVDWRQATIAWKYDRERNQTLLSSAALAAGLAVFGSKNGEVHAVRQTDGVKVWNYRTRGMVDSSPVVVGGRVFVGGGDGRLYALGLRYGEKVWEYEAGGHFLASPAVAQGRLVIGNDAGDLYCFGSNQPFNEEVGGSR